MHTDCFDFPWVLAIDLFQLPPSIKPVQRRICLPVLGHRSGPMYQVYNESEAHLDRVGMITYRGQRNQSLATLESC